MNAHRDIPIGDLYERDFYAWTRIQAKILRDRASDNLDWDHIAEEIESMGNSAASELRNRLITILEHLLKLQYSRQNDPIFGWMRTLNTQRNSLESLFEQNPSMRRRLSEKIAKAYGKARKDALLSFQEHESGVYNEIKAEIPEACPFTETQILDEDFYCGRNE